MMKLHTVSNSYVSDKLAIRCFLCSIWPILSRFSYIGCYLTHLKALAISSQNVKNSENIDDIAPAIMQ